MQNNNNRMQVFLGGTCAGTTWRYRLIQNLKLAYFNPVVEDWTPECIELEDEAKRKSEVHLYVITSAMEGVYSIAEAVESAMTPEVYTVFQVVPEGFTAGQLKSLDAVIRLIYAHGGIAYTSNSIDDTAHLLNTAFYSKLANTETC